jgi:competence protein ComEC
MIEITFKDVGQGDSVIIEWVDNGIKKIAIIDCNKTKLTNPVLEYISQSEYKEIEFLLLSHPHYDHFSGFSDLINYCLKNEIKIKYFLHTSSQVPDFIKAANKSIMGQNEGMELFKLLRSKSFKDSGAQVAAMQGESIASEISVANLFKIKFLAPTLTELDRYASNSTYSWDEEDHGEANANLLSSFLKIYSENWFILLTSDLDPSVFLYYGIKKKEEIQGKLILGQSAHHGSKNNLKKDFWRKLDRDSKTPIVISVGENRYGHPHEEVLNFFNTEGFSIYTTNEIGYLTHQKVPEATEIKNLLDMYSNALPNSKKSKFSGDKKFKISSTGVVTAI